MTPANNDDAAFAAAYDPTLAINTHPQNQPAGLYDRFFMAGSSHPAVATAFLASQRDVIEQKAKSIKTRPVFVRTKRARKRRPYRNIIRYELEHDHVGDRTIMSEVGPITQPVFSTRHRFLHATKGWRTFARVPAGMGR